MYKRKKKKKKKKKRDLEHVVHRECEARRLDLGEGCVRGGEEVRSDRSPAVQQAPRLRRVDRALADGTGADGAEAAERVALTEEAVEEQADEPRAALNAPTLERALRVARQQDLFSCHFILLLFCHFCHFSPFQRNEPQ